MSQVGYLAWYSNQRLDESHALRLLRGLPQLIGCERAEVVYRSDLADYLAAEFLAAELYRLYQHGQILRIEADDAELGPEVESAIEQIPEAVRGDFMPSCPFVSLGIGGGFTDAADETRQRVPFSILIGCWGYSTPSDTQEMRRALASSSKLHEIKVRLEHAVGRLEQRLYLKF